MTSTMATPSCVVPGNCVKITEIYKMYFGYLRFDIRKLHTGITVNGIVIDSVDPECTVVRAAMDIRLHVMGILSNFACSKSTASERVYFPPKEPGVFKYKVDEAGKPKTVQLTDLEIAFEDVEDMNKFQNPNSRVIGFVKTSRGFAIDWGEPCKNGESEIDALNLLENLFNPLLDQYFCASVC